MRIEFLTTIRLSQKTNQIAIAYSSPQAAIAYSKLINH
jgi:hypothetical protein